MKKYQFFGTARNAVQCIMLDTNLWGHPLMLLTYYVIMQRINHKKYVRTGVSTEALLKV